MTPTNIKMGNRIRYCYIPFGKSIFANLATCQFGTKIENGYFISCLSLQSNLLGLGVSHSFLSYLWKQQNDGNLQAKPI